MFNSQSSSELLNDLSIRRETSVTAPAVHIWSFELNETASKNSLRILSEDETARARKFHFERDRQRFIAARGALRCILGSYVDTAPERLKFTYSKFGKPSLSSTDCPLCFNLSHSDERALLAITIHRAVGVDIEKIRPDVDEQTLAERFFSLQEAKSLQTLRGEERPRAFFRVWTCKEAFLKAKGGGLSIPLDSFDVEVDPGKRAGLLSTRPDESEAQQWSLLSLDVGSLYAAAVAVQGGEPEVIFRQWKNELASG